MGRGAALVAAALALSGCGTGGSRGSEAPARAETTQHGGMELIYSAKRGAQPLNVRSMDTTVAILRKRLAAAHLKGAWVGAHGMEVVLLLPGVGSRESQATAEQIGKTAQLYFYDWEPNVIGPSGQPAPSQLAVTGGPNAGDPAFGLPEYEAVLRAAKRPTIIRPNDTTYETGCTPAQINGCTYGEWFLLDTAHKKVLRGPAETRQDLYADLKARPGGAKLKAVRVNPGTIVVRARPAEGAGGKVINPNPNSFYVLNDNPVLSGADIRNPRQSFETQTTSLLVPPHGGAGNGPPNVAFDLTPHGAQVFEHVTKEIARRGQEAQLPGVTKQRAEQHFAIVLDEQLITVPFIDYTVNPEGIDAANGSQIQGDFTVTSARNLADELVAGALPLRLKIRTARSL